MAAGARHALGLILYYLLTGEHLVRGASVSAIAAQHLSGSFGGRMEGDSRVPPGLRDVLREMLSRDPARRPGSASELGERLDRVSAAPAIAETATMAPAAVSMEPAAPPPVKREPRREARQRIQGLLDKLDRKDD